MCCRLEESLAYKELKEQLERQCEKYHDLDESGEIGNGRYKDENGKRVPKENIGEYLRGGVVSTMAVFEAFMSGIIKEAFNVIISECKCKGPGKKCSSTLKDDELELRDVKNSLMVYAFLKVVERGESGEITAEKTPAEKTPAEKTPAEKTPAEKSAAKKTPAGKTPAEKSAAEKSPAEKTPAEKSPAEKTPAEKSAAEKTPPEKKPPEKSATEKSAAKAAALFFGDPPSTLKDFILEHRNWYMKRMTKPLLHDFDEIFRKMFNEKDFSIAEEIFLVTTNHKPIEYYYPLDKCTHTVIEISEKDTICAILRLWYGIRCISAHGMATQTFSKDGALYKFPDCEKCQKLTQNVTRCEELQMLCNGQDLCKEIEKICESEMPEPLEGSVSDHRYAKIKSIPDLKKIQSSGNKKACELVDELKLKQGICSPGNVYYHISRIAFFASKLEKRMYITYRLLVRINQFVLLLAFRIKLTVAKYLVKYSKEENGKIDDLKEGLWGYVDNDDEKVLKLIEKVQREHEEKIKKIQKSTEC